MKSGGKRETGQKRKRRRIRFSKVVVAVVLASVAIFTVTMIHVFLRVGAVPDTLVTAFFAFAGSEAGVLGLLRFAETKYPDQDQGDDSAAG